MKDLLKKVLPIAILAIMFSGCVSSPVYGVLYTGTTHPGVGSGGVVDNDIKIVKTGISTCMSILGLVAFGDCSVDAAKENASITKVNSVDHKATSIYVFFSSYTTIVKGE
jgi:hypothetical protein